MGQDQLKDKLEDKRQRLIYCTKNTGQYQLKRGGGIILNLRSSIMKTFFFCIYTYYWQLRQTDPWLMGSSSLANGAIFFLANGIVVILANGIKSPG